MLNKTDTMTGTEPPLVDGRVHRRPRRIEADTDYCFDTAAEAAEHGAPRAVLENPDAYTAVARQPGPLHHPGQHDDAARCLASREPVRDADRGTRYRFS